MESRLPKKLSSSGGKPSYRQSNAQNNGSKAIGILKARRSRLIGEDQPISLEVKHDQTPIPEAAKTVDTAEAPRPRANSGT